MPNRYELLSSDLVKSDEDSWSSWSSSTPFFSSRSSTDSSSTSSGQKRRWEPNKYKHLRSVEKEAEQKLLNILNERKWLTDDGKPVDYDVLKKYLKEVQESEGFIITDYPGLISGVTEFVPFWSRSENREEFPLPYDGMKNLAALATKNYNIKHQTEFKVVEIVEANTGALSLFDNYYITFSAVDVSYKNYGKGSLLTSLYNQFVNTMRDVAQLIWLKLSIWFTHDTILDEDMFQTNGAFTQSLETPMYKLRYKLVKLQSAPECRAGMDDLIDETLPRKLFQAVVVDDRKPEVLSCRIAKCE